MQAWAQDALDAVTTLETDTSNVKQSIQSLNCNIIKQTADTEVQAALDGVAALKEDVQSLKSDIDDVKLDSYSDYDGVINLYVSLAIGLSILLPMVVTAIMWPLKQANKIKSASYLVSASFATFFMAVLGAGFLCSTIAYSDLCNDIDAVATRLVDDPAFEFYVDCTNGNSIYPEFQTSINDAVLEVDNAIDTLTGQDNECGPNLATVDDALDAIKAQLEGPMTDLVKCDRLTTLYHRSTDVLCGSRTYDFVLHMHQSIFGALGHASS